MSDEIVKALADSLTIANEQTRHWKAQVESLRHVLASQADIFATGFSAAFEAAAREAETGGFIEARDSEWDEGVNYARKFIAARIRALMGSGRNLADANSNPPTTLIGE